MRSIRRTRWDELGAFLGASYFRLLGQGQVYGMSARGLALDCGEAGPAGGVSDLHGLVAGQTAGATTRRCSSTRSWTASVASGAYEFLIQPGRRRPVAEVEAVRLFSRAENILAADPQRKPLATIGLAPLTSMFWYRREFRAQVRRLPAGSPRQRRIADANGQRRKCLASAGQRPGHAPPGFSPPSNIRGFGLLQRDRNFNDYQDLFQRLSRRPQRLGGAARTIGARAKSIWWN